MRLVDIDEARKEYSNLMDLSMSDTTLLHTLYGVLDNAPTVEAIPKDQYEARLKADMVAMLTELYMEIEELDTPSDDSYDACIVDCERIIQEKINKLKGE